MDESRSEKRGRRKEERDSRNEERETRMENIIKKTNIGRVARKITFRSLLPLLLTPLLLLIPISCGDTQSEFTPQRCYFVFENSTHNDATLASAMTPYSGVFTTVTHTMRGGARYFVFTSNQGTSSEKIFNSIDHRCWCPCPWCARWACPSASFSSGRTIWSIPAAYPENTPAGWSPTASPCTAARRTTAATSSKATAATN